MSEKTIELGYLGKIPCMGDFVQDNVDTSFVELWNNWLQAGIAVSKEQLGEIWKDKYLTGPVWHFALSKKIAGDLAKMGTLVPSVDVVGRHYPLTVVSDIDTVPTCVLDSGVFSLEYEDAVLEVLNDSVDMFNWRKKVVSTLSMDLVKPRSFKYFNSPDESKTALIMEFPGTELNKGVVQDTLHAMLYKKYGDYSLWWTQGSYHIAPVVIITSGLPPVNQLAAMLDGRWQHWEWNHTKVTEDDDK